MGRCSEAKLRGAAEYRERNRELIRERDRALYQVRRERVLKHKAEYRKADPEKAFDKELRTRYGITKEDYYRMLSEQDGKCAICFSDKPGSTHHKRFCVDHNKTTGKVRGLLCIKCNTGIGLLQESPENLFSAFNYLEDHKLGIKR